MKLDITLEEQLTKGAEDKSLIFSFTKKAYQELIREYANNLKTLPLEFIMSDTACTVTLNSKQYAQLIQENKTNIASFSKDFTSYKNYLEAQPSKFKKTVLLQNDARYKITEIDKLLQCVGEEKKDQRTTAKKLQANRDEWPWWLLKALATFLTLGAAHYCGHIWKVTGDEKINETNTILKP